MFKFRFPHKPNAKTKLARRVFFVRKRTLAIPAGLAAVCALCLITTLPSYVSAASTQRQLPIYCVQRDQKLVSISFDAAWGNAILRTLSPKSFGAQRPHFSENQYSTN